MKTVASPEFGMGGGTDLKRK